MFDRRLFRQIVDQGSAGDIVAIGAGTGLGESHDPVVNRMFDTGATTLGLQGVGQLDHITFAARLRRDRGLVENVPAPVGQRDGQIPITDDRVDDNLLCINLSRDLLQVGENAEHEPANKDGGRGGDQKLPGIFHGMS